MLGRATLVIGATAVSLLLALGIVAGVGYVRIRQTAGPSRGASAAPSTAPHALPTLPEADNRPRLAPSRPGDVIPAAPTEARAVTTAAPPLPAPPPATPILLSAAAAELHGTDLRLEGDAEVNIGSWRNSADFLRWWVNPPAAGRYRVELTYACDAPGGGVYLLGAGEPTASSIIGPTDPTGGWRAYRTILPGTLTLPAGRTPITLRPAEPLRDGKALMNLRSIKLIPVEE
jgi:hypothetical protein